ncbi:MAG TPA: hypothetical protein VLA99_02585 [Nitrospiraceae bacterium]|nr:hypothetical protein [Nitrospiraceae bacterium]
MPPDQLPSSPSETFDIEGSPMDLYANAEALRHDSTGLPGGTASTAPGEREVRRKRAGADRLEVKRQAIGSLDAPMAALILIVFLLGFFLGRTSRP